MKDRTKTKYHYSWHEFEVDCYELAYQIKSSGSKFTTIYGVPRGGVAIAVRLAGLLNLNLVSRPLNLETLIVDDVVDMGGTRLNFAMFCFASIHRKPWAAMEPNFFVHNTEDWICYPWEVKNESEYPGQD